MTASARSGVEYSPCSASTSGARAGSPAGTSTEKLRGRPSTTSWTEPDHGIWEIRGNPRHHVYSKVMCWMTVDRALKLGDEFDRDTELGWSVLRDTIAKQPEPGSSGLMMAMGPGFCSELVLLRWR